LERGSLRPNVWKKIKSYIEQGICEGKSLKNVLKVKKGGGEVRWPKNTKGGKAPPSRGKKKRASSEPRDLQGEGKGESTFRRAKQGQISENLLNHGIFSP